VCVSHAKKGYGSSDIEENSYFLLLLLFYFIFEKIYVDCGFVVFEAQTLLSLGVSWC